MTSFLIKRYFIVEGELVMEFVQAFLVGGIICALVQIFMEKTKLMPGRIMVILVVAGAVLSALDLFEPLKGIGRAGVTVPLLGFGNVLMEGVKEAIQRQGILGLFTGGLQAAAAGISGALIFGLLAALLFRPKVKK